MARPTAALVDALRATGARLEAGAEHRWAHMGACNCGHLAQTLTALPRDELHRRALARAGDWGQQSVDYCPTSGLPIDDVITTMLEHGLELRDIGELERLSAPDVLARLPPELRRTLDRRDRAHVIAYLRAWAELLEERLLDRAPDRSGEIELAALARAS